MRWLSILAGLLLITCGSRVAADSETVACIDTHVHLDGRYRGFRGLESDFPKAADTALARMQELGIQKSLVLPPPFLPDSPPRYDYEELLPVVRSHPDRLAFLGGGGSLNPMIQEAVAAGRVSDSLRQKFQAKALEILRQGGVGFGEMAAEHLSYTPIHPYVSAPPDHALFLLLADLAAEHDVPIDLHMETVVHDTTTPTIVTSPRNPGSMKANVDAFERLLSHNPRARIVWAHAGSDVTGDRTVDLMRRLLLAHPNLFMSIKVDVIALVDHRPLDAGGELRPEWLALLKEFPDRFTIGSDEFYCVPGKSPPRAPFIEGPMAFLRKLPPDLARKIGTENAARIYHLPVQQALLDPPDLPW